MSLLKELPSCQKNKKGWPWTQEAPPLPEFMPDGSEWPKISIVTPSFNQGQFIEETIRSVLLQNYPNLEYIIIDGGSTDQSVEIIKKYEPWLTYWVSEKDRGQSHAINKGFERSTGDIMNWLCSDDLFVMDCFVQIAEKMDLEQPCWLIGGAISINQKSVKIKTIQPRFDALTLDTFVRWCAEFFPQSSTFWNKSLWLKIEKVDEQYHYVMDVDLWFRFFSLVQPEITTDIFSSFRNHCASKTHSKQTVEFVLREQAIWNLKNLYGLNDSSDLTQSLIQPMMNLQNDISRFQRIKSHLIFGPLLRLWKKWINPNLPI